ncbi:MULTISPECIES: sodium/glutamate symporter [unclassified Hydrogenophaga]|uniref:sodium/glutamate symporter n=1 Tax=unclassified Hydrogenophaga TaxID=2610897 RepID=UPI000878B858|nr:MULTISPECIES: sodium/glutamate symporter [unclassified Hydrogenophaga]MBN9372904.1 sodium/glutamate symporter [Hydrogenophaga sp.]OJV48548.1 MAG: sodium/glutamate symporter [Hydrogenophaga sp. 70-12]
MLPPHWRTTHEIDAFVTLTLAILLLFIGKGLMRRYEWLRRFNIPEAVVGGMLCALVVCALYYLLDVRMVFTLGARDMLLLYFFAAIGMGTDVRTLREGGRPLLVLLALASGFMLLQNGLGMAVAGAFGMDPRAGLMAGSISLTGGVGTTLAWMPHFTDTLGIAEAGELGLAANMVGMVAACLVGGPMAAWLMRRHRIAPSGAAEVEVGLRYQDEPHARLDYQGVLLALLWLNLALMLGEGLNSLVALTGLKLPGFVGCLMAGIALRGLGQWLSPNGERLWDWSGMRLGVALIGDVSLGLFLTMALMGLQLWVLEPVMVFMTTVMALQIVLAVGFTALVVFRCMGRDYEATVICSGFGGIALGSTATAIANMSAIVRVYGAAPRAFLVVPLVCGFFIDLVNALVIGVLAR